MTVRSSVEAGRRLAESLMLDKGRSRRTTGPPVLDPATGNLTPATAPVYDGKLRVRSPSLEELNAVFGEAVVTTLKFLVSVPWTAPIHEVGDVIEVYESQDPVVLGSSFRVVAVPRSTFIMYRRLGVEVIE